jgi:NAD(P)-dependent dehydrogenase (short-subunit alcohol dehydrogenase family)
MGRLEGKVAVITAAAQGIGRAAVLVSRLNQTSNTVLGVGGT